MKLYHGDNQVAEATDHHFNVANLEIRLSYTLPAGHTPSCAGRRGTTERPSGTMDMFAWPWA